MAKPPFFPFFYQDFLIGTRFFTNAQCGAYIRLLLDQWDLHILKEKHFVARMNGISQEECSEIRLKFKAVCIRNVSGFQNERLEKVRVDVTNFSKKQSDNGKLGGRPKGKPNSKPNNKPNNKPNESQTKPKQKPPNPNPNPNPNLNPNLNSNALTEEKKSRKSPLTPWPEGFKLNTKMTAYAKERGVHDPELEFETFKNWCDREEKEYKNWEAAWRTRCDNYVKFEGRERGTRKEDRYEPEGI